MGARMLCLFCFSLLGGLTYVVFALTFNETKNVIFFVSLSFSLFLMSFFLITL